MFLPKQFRIFIVSDNKINVGNIIIKQVGYEMKAKLMRIIVNNAIRKCPNVQKQVLYKQTSIDIA